MSVIRRLKRKLLAVSGLILVCLSFTMIYGPYIEAWIRQRSFESEMAQVDGYDSGTGEGSQSGESWTGDGSQSDTYETGDDSGTGDGGTSDSGTDRNELYSAMLEYNRRIVSEHQAGITDLQSFEQVPEELRAYADVCIGYVEVPSINVKLPLYIGAGEEHLDRGAAVLSQTSMPTGGRDTNCVIAGHRGWKSSKYFKDIEEIQIGDPVYVTNDRETLEYTVTGIDIIDPDESDAVLIRDGKDMVTLLTCHPYMSGGRYRYAVYCQRDTSSGTDVSAQVDTDKGLIRATNGEIFDSSSDEIQLEDELRLAAAVLAPVVLILSLIYRKFHRNDL